jgi:hypothetical protein
MDGELTTVTSLNLFHRKTARKLVAPSKLCWMRRIIFGLFYLQPIKALYISTASYRSIDKFLSSLIRKSRYSMSSSSDESSAPVWNPPTVIEDLFSKTSGNQFASINAPTAGARVQQDLPKGDAPLQLYSLATPTGQKVCSDDSKQIYYKANTLLFI